MNLRRFVATSQSPLARAARSVYRGYNDFSIPAPRAVVVPALYGFLAAREAYYFGMRVFVCEPLFKAYCKEYGKGLHTGVYIHWITGKGDIILGDNVLFDGQCSIAFAARISERPTLKVGSNSEIGHQCRFTIGKSITIGNNVHIASGCSLFDSSGHPSDPDARARGLPPSPDDVKPIVIHDNVWIARGVTICPNVTIGEGSVVSLGAVVASNVPPYSMVSGNPARVIGSVKPRVESREAAR